MAFNVTSNSTTGFSVLLDVPLIETFTDDFNDNSLDTTKWDLWDVGHAVETGGELQIASVTAASYRGMQSVRTGNLTDSAVHVEVPHVLTGLTDASTCLQVAVDDQHTITLYESGGFFVAEYQIDGVWTTPATMAYGATTHRWWRIREAGGTLYYEYSADGATWSALTSVPTPFAVTAMYTMLFIGTSSTNVSTDTAIFDNVNTMPTMASSRAQYRNDQYTPIAVGGNTSGDGSTNDVWLDADVYSETPTVATTLHAEVKAVGVGFTNTATVSSTARILKQAELITARRGGSLVYDAKNKRYILFGGYNGTTRFNEVWQLTADNGYHRWSKLAPSGTPPTAKNLAASTYARGTTSGAVDKAYMVIFGGSSPSDLNEMHCLDLSTPGSEAWSTITQTNTPLVRSYLTHHMVAKSTASNTNDIYLFGGWGAARYNDLLRCTFNVNTPTAVTWTTVKANGAVGNPGIRSGTGMIYDSANDRLIITCGYNGTTYLSDVWQFAIGTSTFSQITPGGSAPAGRELPSIVYDSVNQRAIVMAGWQGNINNSRNDIYELSLESGSETWTSLHVNDLSNQSFLAYSSGAATINTDRNVMVVATMNGYDSTVKYVYALDLAVTTTSATVHSLNVIDHFRARDAAATTYDSALGEVVQIGGYGTMDDDTTITRGDHISEIWAYNPTTNTLRYAAGGPFVMPQSEGGIVIYDSANDRIIHFGGLNGGSNRTSDVWELRADAFGMYHATKLTVSGTPPNPRWLMAGCYDSVNQRLVIWGGQGVGATVLSDTWALNLTEGAETWTQLTPTGTGPTAAWQPAYSYDTANKRLYIHGGTTNAAGTTFTSQLFYLDLTTTNGAWTNTGVTGGLAVRGASMVYDSTNQRLVCFAGYDGSVVNNTIRYTSTASFTSWTTQATANTPSARRSAGWILVGGKFIVLAGRPVSGTWFSDTQSLDITALPAAWSWVNKSPSIYQVMSVAATALSVGTSYHWQSWTTSGTDSSVPQSFGGNAESAADFIVNGTTGGYIKVWGGVAFASKPIKVWDGASWVMKPLKRWNGSEWVLTPGAASGIALRDISSNTGVTVNTLGVTMPSSIQVGDLLVLVVSQTTNAATVFNAISGWTKQGEQRAGGAGYTLAVYTRVAQSGDAGGTVTSTSVNAAHYTGHLRVYSGVDQTTPLDTSAVFSELDVASFSASAPAVTVATTNAMLVAIYGIPTVAGTSLSDADWTAPAGGFSSEVVTCPATGSSNRPCTAVYDRITSGTGSQGPFEATTTQDRRWSLVTLALRPA
ncbi:MAG: hypothetical protein HZB75_00320 [Candidatus Saccharibacteria bacterium]|nr:MAG: hypothetical protein HZB75_00320 [Candidatus Saccharibacteria bacterium]